MNRIALAAARLLVSASLIFSGHNFRAQAAPNDTPICGSFGTSTWNLAGSPYTVCAAGATLSVGATLTIDPGVTVLFDNGAGAENLVVQGKLIANGTVTQTIAFTSTTHTAGSWGGISVFGTVLNPASASLRHTRINYGGLAGSSGAAVYANNAVITVTDSLIGNSAGNGIFVASSARLDAHAVDFVGNGQRAIELSQPTTDLVMTELTASGNGIDGVFLSGSTNWVGQHRIMAPGIPYYADGPIGNLNVGDILTIDPGNSFKFTTTGWLYVRGRLNAVGTPGEPILFTGQTPSPGSWRGMFIDGGQHQAVAQLDYVTIEYGGSGTGGANIDVANGRLIVRHSIIRHSSKDGVRFATNWGGSIQESQIVSNTLYGIHNGSPLRAVLATNNWWGDPLGPLADNAACSPGAGSKVTNGVFFLPVLISPTATVQFPLSTAPILTVVPRRWFAPADGFTRIYFDITVVDGNGVPLPGRIVGLVSSLGSVVAGGVTDANGKTLAYLTSANAGDADVSATLNVVPCEGYIAPEIRVTFSPPILVTDLFPNAQAPYLADEITVGPLPLVSGVTATIGTQLTNPLTVPVTVDVSFGFADAGIGLVFGPLGDINGLVVPANGSVFLAMPFPIVVSGHYCIQISYEITQIGSTLLAPQGGGRQLKQFNLNVKQGPMGSQSSKEILKKTDKVFRGVSKIPAGPTLIQKGLLSWAWGAAMEKMGIIDQNLGGDPPRQDYNVVTVAEWHSLPDVAPDGNISAARAAAVNAINDSYEDMEAYGTAATVALDRYGGASAAANLQWSSEQANAQLHFQELLGTALLTFADRMDTYVQLLESENETATNVSAGEVISYQQRLVSTGFTGQEVAEAHAIGLTDEEIEAFRQSIIAADPIAVAGDLLVKYAELAVTNRELGNALLNPPNFEPGFSISGSPGLQPDGGGGDNSMALVLNTITTFKLSNPLTQTAQIDLKPRRISLPGDWTVVASPAQITLAPGEITTITVSVLTGSPVPQGTIPRLAVEGYVGSQLIGGMVIDILVPRYDPFAGLYNLTMPLLHR